MHPASLLYCTEGYTRATGICLVRGGGGVSRRNVNVARLPRSVETINYCTDSPGMSGIQSLLLSCGAGGGGGSAHKPPA